MINDAIYGWTKRHMDGQQSIRTMTSWHENLFRITGSPFRTNAGHWSLLWHYSVRHCLHPTMVYRTGVWVCVVLVTSCCYTNITVNFLFHYSDYWYGRHVYDHGHPTWTTDLGFLKVLVLQCSSPEMLLSANPFFRILDCTCYHRIPLCQIYIFT